MPCVSDTGATAPISALTYAFSIGGNRGQSTDDFELDFSEYPLTVDVEQAKAIVCLTINK